MSWEYEAQRVAEERIDKLAAYEEECECLPVEEWPEHPPAIAPYCGCQTCVVREVLAAAWPIMRQAALEGAPE